MYFAPHILQKRVTPVLQDDEYGRPIPADMPQFVAFDGVRPLEFCYGHMYAEPLHGNLVYWMDICQCRCDQNSEREVKGQDGDIVKSDYHVVCDCSFPDVKASDYVRAVTADGKVVGEGKVINVHRLNYLPYAEIDL